LALVNPLAEVMERLTRADESNSFIQAEYLFLSVGEAVAKLSSTMKNPPSISQQQESLTKLPVEGSPKYSSN
ncbi:hypothetical protein PIB30_108752, partial [Stylosanthes scabra]|nr:hypothetical protein [Stylosanthes scabra]